MIKIYFLEWYIEVINSAAVQYNFHIVRQTRPGLALMRGQGAAGGGRGT